jgi:sulfonate transport system ATP-binding protein
VLEVRDLALSYDSTPILEGVNLSISTGQFVSLVGPSGSGKSTLLRAITGLLKPLSGTIDMSVGRDDVGILFQDDALLPWRRADENVALGLRLKGVDRAEAMTRATRWLDRLGLDGLGKRFPRELSGGQRKRVALAQVLARRPKLLLMDEPFSAVDAIVRARLTQDLVRLVEAEDIAVLLVTHDLEEALALSDLVYLLSRGPHAHMSQHYVVPIRRPRDVIKARTDPAFAPLLETLWQDLSREVVREKAPDEAAWPDYDI